MQDALDLIINHFRGAAMSHGALTGASHQTLAAAFNEIGGYSNAGEGGEARNRNDAPERPWGPFWEKTLAEREALTLRARLVDLYGLPAAAGLVRPGG